MTSTLTISVGRFAKQETRNDFKAITKKVLGDVLCARGVKTVTIEAHRRGDYISPNGDAEEFSISINAQAHERNDGYTLTPASLWEIRNDLGNCNVHGRLMAISGDGIVITEPETFYPVAEIVKNSLYILFDLTNAEHMNDHVAAVYEKILKEAAALLGGKFPSLEAMAANKFRMPSSKLLAVMQDNLEASRMELERRVRYDVELQARLGTAGERSAADGIITRIANIPEIKKVDMRHEDMVLTTYTMYGVDPRNQKLHEYGEFEIVVGFGRNANAVFRNLTRTVRTRNRYGDEITYGHPHVQRGDHGWCAGEGRQAIDLLEKFEFEAGILFLIKAIDSVNDSTDGNYLDVLREFPVVAERMKYPKKNDELDGATKERFARIFPRTMDAIREKIEEDREDNLKQIFADRETVMRAVLAQTLQREKDVAKKLQNEIRAMKNLPGIAGVVLSENTLSIPTLMLRATDTSTGKEYEIGEFSLRFDFSAGRTELIRTYASRGPRGLTALPYPLRRDGELPLGQLTSTLPELMGSLELETAVTMVLSFIQQFDGMQVPLPTRTELQALTA